MMDTERHQFVYSIPNCYKLVSKMLYVSYWRGSGITKGDGSEARHIILHTCVCGGIHKYQLEMPLSCGDI